MSYVKITGANVGTCLTGFGIHYPVTIFNSGNSEVLYNIKNSNETNFILSDDSFVINANDYNTFDIFYKPTISAPAVDETTNLTISSVSIEDGSVDPSGDITLNITGTSILNITGGNSRSFRVLTDFKNLSYDFYWKHPTGITGDNLHNYFITGYNLQLSSLADFGSILYEKNINVSYNTDLNPKYSTYYGFGDNDLNFKIDKNIYPSLDRNISYYARLYTYCNNNTGVSVYASGVDYIDQPVSNEVFIGYSGAPIDLKIEKRAFNFYVPVSTFFSYTYDLYAQLISQNGSADFSAYSGINIYLPPKSVFESQDLNKGAISIDGEFLNLTGVGGTFINIYVPNSTEIRGRIGDGTNVYFSRGMYLNKDPQQLIAESVAHTDPNNPLNVYSDSTDGGPCLTLKARTNNPNVGIRTDIKYNIYNQIQDSEITNDFGNGLSGNTRIASGSGGGKGGFLYVWEYLWGNVFYAFLDTINENSPFYYNVIPFNGAQPKGYLQNTITNRKYWYYKVFYYIVSRIYVDLESLKPIIASVVTSYINSPYMNYGEAGSAYLTITDPNTNIIKYLPYNTLRSVGSANQLANPLKYSTDSWWNPINNIKQLNRKPGYLIDSFSDSSVKFTLYNNILASDYIFRFRNEDIVSASSWPALSTYTLSSTNVGTKNSNYQNLGLNCINLKNSQFMKIDFTNTVPISDFDLFFICSFDNFNDPTITGNEYSDNIYASLFDWNSTNLPDKITENQFNIRRWPELNYARFPKEYVSFNYSNTCLMDLLSLNKSLSYNSKISKQLKTLLQIQSVSSNEITTTTPHGLSNGDIVGFYGDNLYSGISDYDTVSPYIRKTYYVIDAAANPNKFKISDTSGGSAITLGTVGSGTIYILNSNSLYRPFILNIRRSGGLYQFYINRVLYGKIDFVTKASFIEDLNGTTLKIINRNANIGINYFDITFYNRLLTQTELDAAYSYFINYYLKLFAGEAGISSLNLKSDLYSYRLPNIFNVAGRT